MSRTPRIALLLDTSDENRRRDLEDAVRRLAKDDDGNWLDGVEGLELRPIYRQPPHRAIYLGWSEYRLIYETHPDVVFAESLQPWDMPFAHTPVPFVWLDDNMPADKMMNMGAAAQALCAHPHAVLDTRKELWQTILDLKWNLPYLNGELVEKLKDAKKVAILKPGCGRQEDDDIAIATSPLSAFDDPYPDYFLIDDHVATTPGVSGVYEEVQWTMGIGFPYRTIEKDAKDDPKLAHLEEAARIKMLVDLDQKDAQAAFWNRAVIRSSLGKLPFTEVGGSVLGSACPAIRLENGMTMQESWMVLAYTLLSSNANLTVVLRHTPEFETRADEAMAQVALEEAFGERFAAEATDPAPELLPIHVDVAGEGISGPAAGPPLAEWLRNVRYGDLDRTSLTTIREYEPFLRAHGFPETLPDDVDAVATITLRPKPLFPL